MVVVEIAIERCPNSEIDQITVDVDVAWLEIDTHAVESWTPEHTVSRRCGSPDRRPSSSLGYPRAFPAPARNRPPRQDQSWPTFQKGFPSPSPVVHAFLTSFARFFPEILERDQYRLFHDQKSVKNEQECKLKGKSISPSTSQSHHHLTIFALLRFKTNHHQGRTMLPKIFCLHGISTYYQSLFAIWITDINWRQNKISIKLRAKWWLHL